MITASVAISLGEQLNPVFMSTLTTVLAQERKDSQILLSIMKNYAFLDKIGQYSSTKSVNGADFCCIILQIKQ